MFSSLGIIGTGPMGMAVAGHALKSGRTVLIANSRGPETLGHVVTGLGDGAEAASVAEAAAADLVVLAAPFGAVPEIGAAGESWKGKTVIDITNAFAQSKPFYDGRADTGDLTASEWVLQYLPGAKLVKVFNDLPSKYLAADPRRSDGSAQVAFIAGNDTDAKAAVIDLISEWGFVPVDVGDLHTGAALTDLDGRLHNLALRTQA